MLIYHDLSRQSETPTVAALGFFDGVHLGHRAVIAEALCQARKQGAKCAVFTFEPPRNTDRAVSKSDVKLLQSVADRDCLLEELGVEGTPVITVLNKCDAAPDAENEPYKGCVRISAKTGYGLPQLLAAIAETLPPGRIRCRLCLPYTEGGLLHRLEQQGQIFSREYTAEGTLLEAEVEQRDWRLFESYLKTED